MPSVCDTFTEIIANDFGKKFQVYFLKHLIQFRVFKCTLDNTTVITSVRTVIRCGRFLH